MSFVDILKAFTDLSSAPPSNTSISLIVLFLLCLFVFVVSPLLVALMQCKKELKIEKMKQDGENYRKRLEIELQRDLAIQRDLARVSQSTPANVPTNPPEMVGRCPSSGRKQSKSTVTIIILRSKRKPRGNLGNSRHES